MTQDEINAVKKAAEKMKKQENERCKHTEKDGYRCGSYAFNLYKDDIDQGELCDVHYWQERALKAEGKLKEQNNG
jgi:hypothetical protein